MGNQKGVKMRNREGETDLSWDHEGLEPYPSPERPKPPRDPKEKGTPKEDVKRNETLNRGSKAEESQEEGKEHKRKAGIT